MLKNLLGRKKIVIPISKEDFNKDIVYYCKEFINNAVQQHNKNVEEIQYLHQQYLGEQDILNSKKRYDSSEINNKIVENHTYRQVNFKVGFMYGNPLEYTIVNEEKVNTNDMKYLNAYMVDSDKASLDIEKAQDLYEFGIAYQRLFPKREKVEDYNSESPYELVNMPVESTFLVFSNDIPNQELFGVVIGSKYNIRLKKKETIYHIYLPNRKLEIKEYNKEIINDIPQPYNYIPIQEYCLNKDRIGIIEIALSLNDTINKINSSQMDDIEENVNAFIALFNQKTDDDFIKKFKELKKEKVIVLNTNNPQAPADIKMVSSKLDQQNSNTFYERTVKASYDIVSVPQASSNVTSGGDTGDARKLGNGWESAQNQAQVDQTFLSRYERNLLKNIIWICKNTLGCPIKEINASDVAIKFNINMSNNLYIKSEAMKMLNDINLPEKAILNIVGITKDVDGLGDAWKKNKEEQLQKEIEREEQKINQGNTNNENNKNQ